LAEDGYQQSIRVRAPRERLWDAVDTVDGPRHWWTTAVSGSAEAGGELRFGFAGLPGEMVARRRPPAWPRQGTPVTSTTWSHPAAR
jgi:hypothetical protein